MNNDALADPPRSSHYWLRQALRDCASSARNIWALVRPWRLISPSTVFHSDRPTATCVYDGPALRQPKQQSPWLVPLDAADPEALLSALFHGDHATVIVADATAEDVAQHLRGLAVAQGPNGVEQSVCLSRPSVVQALVRSSTPEQRLALLGPALELWCRDPDAPLLLQYRLASSPQQTRAIDLEDGFHIERALGQPPKDPIADDLGEPDHDPPDDSTVHRVMFSGGALQLRAAQLSALARDGRASIVGPGAPAPTLSAQQLRALRAVERNNLRGEVANVLRRVHPELTYGLTTAELEERIRVAILRAQRHGMTSVRTAGAFAQLMFLVSPNFDEQPTIAALLRRTNLKPADRLAALFEQISPEQWRAARDAADPRAWSTEGQ